MSAKRYTALSLDTGYRAHCPGTVNSIQPRSTAPCAWTWLAETVSSHLLVWNAPSASVEDVETASGGVS